MEDVARGRNSDKIGTGADWSRHDQPGHLCLCHARFRAVWRVPLAGTHHVERYRRSSSLHRTADGRTGRTRSTRSEVEV